MLKLIALTALLSLMACQQPEEVQADNTGELQKAQAQVQLLEKENAELKAEKSKVQPSAKKAKAKPKNDMDEDYEGDDTAMSTPSHKLCWQDYCPCEPGQDGQGLEASLCRNLKAGIHVDDKIMATAAMSRDARRQLRDFKQQNPDF